MKGKTSHNKTNPNESKSMRANPAAGATGKEQSSTTTSTSTSRTQTTTQSTTTSLFIIAGAMPIIPNS